MTKEGIDYDDWQYLSPEQKEFYIWQIKKIEELKEILQNKINKNGN